jgi:hypothetical protein
VPRAPRSEIFDPQEIAIVHTVQRCVRRAYLAGKDAVSGKNHEPRREWIRRRLEVLASVFGIDILSYAILSNHMHLVLRTRPDVVQTWSDHEVALRWLKLFPGRRLDEYLGLPTENDIATLARDSKRLKKIRLRLSDISWFMRSASEPIARMANREDQCTGRFWEGRFRAQRIVDEAGLLACAMYVDLNPVRAALASTPEESRHTSAYDRIQGLKGAQVPSLAAEVVPISQTEAASERKSIPLAERRRKASLRKQRRSGRQILRDAWLSPLTIRERDDQGAYPSRSGVRASDKGFLAMSLKDYLNLLDWTGRQGRPDKRGKIPDSLKPIFARLGICGEMWSDLVWNFRRYFARRAGSPEHLKEDASRNDRHWHRGQRAARSCFTVPAVA